MMSETEGDTDRGFMINEVQIGIDHPYNDGSNLLDQTSRRSFSS